MNTTEINEITDDNGKPLQIGVRVGCRAKGHPRSMSIRGLILAGYEPGTPEPYLTSGGRFAHAIKDHQPDMDQWIGKHVS